MTTQTKAWDAMTGQEKVLALAGIMGLETAIPNRAVYVRVRPGDWHLPNWLTDYTDCLAGPVAWAKEQGWYVTVESAPTNSGYTAVTDTLGKRLGDALGYSPDDICRAIWEAAMVMRKEQVG